MRIMSWYVCLLCLLSKGAKPKWKSFNHWIIDLDGSTKGSRWTVRKPRKGPRIFWNEHHLIHNIKSLDFMNIMAFVWCIWFYEDSCEDTDAKNSEDEKLKFWGNPFEYLLVQYFRSGLLWLNILFQTRSKESREDPLIMEHIFCN